MSLCYDFQKWTITSIALVTISLTVGLVLMQYAYGITEEQRQANRERYAGLIEEEIKQQIVVNPAYIQQKEMLKELLDYCFQHADRPNPIQDLVDKGFLSETFTGETCISVRQMIDEVETRIREQVENILACARNQSTTYEECSRIFHGSEVK